MTSAAAAVSAMCSRLIQRISKQHKNPSGPSLGKMLQCKTILGTWRQKTKSGIWVTHVNKVLVEAFSQVVQEGRLTSVGVQEDKVLDAHTVPGC